MERMFLRFFPGEDARAKSFAEKLPSGELSMATLQGHFIKDGQTPQEAVDTATRFVFCFVLFCFVLFCLFVFATVDSWL